MNPLQLALLDAWRGTSTDLCVVGDPHQAIYGWNGADAGFLSGFRRLYPSADVVVLDGNYRSTPQILGAAADVLRACRRRGPDGAPGPPRRPPRPARAPPHRPGRGGRHRPGRPGPAAPRGRPGRRRRCWSAPTPRSRSSPRRSAARASPTGCGAASRCSTDRRRGPRSTCSAAPRAADGLPARPRRARRRRGRRPATATATRSGAAIGALVRLAQDHLRLDPGATASGFVVVAGGHAAVRGR